MHAKNTVLMFAFFGTAMFVGNIAHAQTVLPYYHFPRSARSLDWEFWRTSSECWLLRADPNLSGANGPLRFEIRNDVGTILSSAQVALPFSLHGSLVPLQAGSFLASGAVLNTDGTRTGVLAIVGIAAPGGNASIHIAATESYPSIDPVSVCTGIRSDDTRIYIFDSMGKRALVGPLAQQSGAWVLPTATALHTIVDSTAAPWMKRSLELGLSIDMTLDGREIISIRSMTTGWGERIRSENSSGAVPGPWLNTVDSTPRNSGLEIKDPGLSGASRLLEFRMPGRLAGPYDLFDATSATVVTSGSAVAGDNQAVPGAAVAANPGHRYRLRSPGVAHRTLWLPVRYGQGGSTDGHVALDRIMFEPAQAVVGAPYFGYACPVWSDLATPTPVRIEAWINIRTPLSGGGYDDHIVNWQGHTLLSPALAIPYDLTAGHLRDYVGVGAEMSSDPSWAGLVYLCQFIAFYGNDQLAYSEIIGVGLRGDEDFATTSALASGSGGAGNGASGPTVQVRQQAMQQFAGAIGGGSAISGMPLAQRVQIARSRLSQ